MGTTLLEQFPFLKQLFESLEKKSLLLTIKGHHDEDNPFEGDELLANFVYNCHNEYDDLLEDKISIEQRFQLHRILEKCLVDNGYLCYGDDEWFVDQYDYPPVDIEDFWDRLAEDQTDPFFNYTEEFLVRRGAWQ